MKLISSMTISLFLLVVSTGCGPNRLFDSFRPQFSSEDACGFVQNVYGQRISWKGRFPIKLKIHESFPSGLLPALDSAIKAWETSAGKKLFEVTASSEAGPLTPRQDGENVIYWISDKWEENKPSEQARTTVYWVGDQIHEADIRVNAKNFSFYLSVPQNASDVHLESLLIHELGHVLGLKHRDDGSSVMGTYLAASTERDSVSKDDATDLKCEY